MLRGTRVLLIGLAFAIGVATASQAQQGNQLREQINSGTVSVISGGVSGTYIRVTADLADVLDSNDLRVLSIIGKGSVQNVADLLYLKGIDIAIVQSDVLEYLKSQQIYSNIENRIHYITKLYNEELHILAKNTVNSLTELAGKSVNFDVKNSGTAMTAAVVFDVLDIAVEPTYYDQAAALEKLRNDELAALVYVAGKPAQLFQKISQEQNFHFLSIDFTPALLEIYLPARLTNEDYPNIIPPGQEVSTLAVGAVMAVYNWKRANLRHKKVARFVNAFFDHVDELQQPSRHPKWQEVSLHAQVPGWKRFEVAEKWLERNSNP